jgi:hypothetical protein
MPPEGLDWLPSPALLTDSELARLIGIAVQQLGITEVRFTGGEPLLRRGLPGIVARTAALRPRPPAGRSRGRSADRHLAPYRRRQAAGTWHQRLRVPSADPADVSHRRLSSAAAGLPS